MGVWLVAQHVRMRELEDLAKTDFFIERHCMCMSL